MCVQRCFLVLVGVLTVFSDEEENQRRVGQEELQSDSDSDPYATFRKLYEDGAATDHKTTDLSLSLDGNSLRFSPRMLTPTDWLHYLEQNLMAIGQVIPGPYAVYAGDSDGVFFKAHTDGYDLDHADEVASGSKWHTSIAILALVEEGKIDFKALASKYLSFWTKDQADPRSRVKVRHLLQFTSGFGSNTKRFWHDCIGEETYTYKSCAEHIYTTTYGRFRSWETIEPGTYFFYDHTHTDILAAIAEEVTGKSWMDIYKEKVADKIGFVIKPDGSNGWGYGHSDISKKLHISANDYAKFMTSLFKTVNGKGPLLQRTETVKLFQEVSVLICQGPNGTVTTGGVYCGGWLGDKITYASTYFVGLDSQKYVYHASPGHWGFWPEMLLQGHQNPDKALPFGGFWWQLAIQLPATRDSFFSVEYYKVAEAVRKFLLPSVGGYQKSWGLVTGKLPKYECVFPHFCGCAVSETYPKHPAEKRRCDAGIRDSCTSSQFHDAVCAVATTQTNLYASPILTRQRLKKAMHQSCTLDACLWGSHQMVTAGCPSSAHQLHDTCQERNKKAGVRCCSDSGYIFRTDSGYKPYGCESSKNFVEASLKCSSYGLRLCSKHELSNLCWKTGCDELETAPVWVRDNCAPRPAKCIAASDVDTNRVSQVAFFNCLRQHQENASMTQIMKLIPDSTTASERGTLEGMLNNGCSGQLVNMLTTCTMPASCKFTGALQSFAAKAGAMGNMTRCQVCRADCSTSTCGDATSVAAGGTPGTCSPIESPTPSPTKVTSTPSPTEAPSTQSPTEASSTPSPTEAPSTPSPTQASSTPSPTNASSTPSPTEVSSTPSPTEAPSTPSPTNASSSPSPTQASSTPSPTNASSSIPSPTQASPTPSPTEASSTPSPTEASATPSPTGASSTPSPTEASSTPSPTEAPSTPSPTEASSTPSPTEVSSTPSPTESPSTPSPTEASSTPSPTSASSTPSPTDVSVTPSPTNASSTQSPTQASSIPSPTNASSTPSPTQASSTPSPTEASSTQSPTEVSSTPSPTQASSTPSPTNTASTPSPTEVSPTPSPTNASSMPSPTKPIPGLAMNAVKVSHSAVLQWFIAMFATSFLSGTCNQ